MTHTPTIERAIKKAALLHHGQTRKGDVDYPYVTHLFSVAAIISEHTDDEDVIIAGLLHDTLEDTTYTYEELKEEFGARVAEIVAGVTIPPPQEGEHRAWADGYATYAENLAAAPTESAIVSAADKLHNFRTTVEDYGHQPKKFWEHFGGSAESRVAAYGKILDVIIKKLGPGHPLSREVTEAYRGYRTVLDASV